MANIAKPTTLNIIWASTGTKVDPGVTKTNIGWVVQLPPYEYQNWVDNRQDVAIAHFNQHGIPEWDVNTEYQGNLSYTQGSNGLIYKCISTHTGLDPINPNNSLSWVRAFEDYGSVQVVQSALTAHLNNYATLSGISNIVAARANLSVYGRAEADAAFAFKGGTSTVPFQVSAATLGSHAVSLAQLNSLLVGATETTPGTTIYATTVEVEQATLDTKSVSPLKGGQIYLKKSGNLAGLGNITTARSNLGLGSIATRAAGEFLLVANNLSDIHAPTARSNLGLTSTATQPEPYFLRTANNLADVPSASAARNNLGLTGLATTDPTTVLFKADNLAGLSSPATARANLGLGDAATQSAASFLRAANNLSDLSNVQAARNNLQLGALATASAFGSMSPDLDFTALLAASGYQKLPSGLVLQWGQITTTGQNGTAGPIPGIPYNPQIITFPMPFPNAVVFVIGSEDGANSHGLEMVAVDWRNNTNRTQFGLFSNYAGQCRWFAVGY